MDKIITDKVIYISKNVICSSKEKWDLIKVAENSRLFKWIKDMCAFGKLFLYELLQIKRKMAMYGLFFHLFFYFTVYYGGYSYYYSPHNNNSLSQQRSYTIFNWYKPDAGREHVFFSVLSKERYWEISNFILFKLSEHQVLRDVNEINFPGKTPGVVL